MKVLTVVGNRPQFIKSAPVSVALRAAGIDEIVLHTGQHYDPELSQVFFDELGLPQPDFSLDLHTAEPNLMQPSIAAIVRETGPDWVLVYGDTNSTLAGGRASVETSTPLVHVEAGLRSGDCSMPEEHTRIEVDAAAQLLLCPDERARDTLTAEGVAGRIEVIGDVMYDVCLRFRELAPRRSDALRRFGVTPGEYVVATVHREANVEPGRLTRIAAGLGRLEENVVFAAHPRTRAALAELRIDLPPRVQLTPPLGYLDLAVLVSQARLVVTDSGGLQKEAYWYEVPCVTLRPSTEWVDTVEAGANRLVDDDPDLLVQAAAEARFPAGAPALYGDGHAAERLADALYTLSRR